jgi:hypothetical protein
LSFTGLKAINPNIYPKIMKNIYEWKSHSFQKPFSNNIYNPDYKLSRFKYNNNSPPLIRPPLNTITIVPLLSGHSSVMKGGLIRGVASPEGDNWEAVSYSSTS